MGKIILSICIPTYNREIYLNKCLNSIIKYKGYDIEIVISDNASNDMTKNIVKRIRDPRIKYYRNKNNLGYDANILELVKKSKGEFLFFISDEDYININSINWIINKVQENSRISQVLGTIVDKRTKQSKLYFVCKDNIYKKGHESLINLLFENFYLSGIVLRKDSLDIEKAKEYIGTLYMHKILQAQAMIKGDTLCISQVFCFIGEKGINYIYNNNKPYWDPLNKINHIENIIKLVYYITQDEYTQNVLINKIRKYVVSLLFNYLNSNLSLFFKTFRKVIKIKRVSKSCVFWISLFKSFIYLLLLKTGLINIVHYIKYFSRMEDLFKR